MIYKHSEPVIDSKSGTILGVWPSQTPLAFCSDKLSRITNRSILLTAPTEWKRLYDNDLPIAFACGEFFYLFFNDSFAFVGADLGWILVGTKEANYGAGLELVDMEEHLTGSDKDLLTAVMTPPDKETFPGEKHLTNVLQAMRAYFVRYIKIRKIALSQLDKFAQFGQINPAPGAKQLRRLTRRGIYTYVPNKQ